jgi:hypothetical protein
LPVVHADGPLEFVLTDELGDDEISEQATVLIDGKNVGDLTVDRDYPNSKLTITVPQGGRHSYTVEADAKFNMQGRMVLLSGAGQGMIDVQPGRNYSLRGSISGNTWLVSIMQEN